MARVPVVIRGVAEIPDQPGGGQYPDQGLPGGGNYPDQGLPGGGLHPDQGLPGGGLRPDQGLPGQGHRPDQGLPRPPWQGQPPTIWPPSPVDPEWGIPAGESPQHPIYIPATPDNTLPPGINNSLPAVPGHPPPENAPPGTVYPPIAGAPQGNAWMKTETIPGVGHRYVMATFPVPDAPDNTLPDPNNPQPKV